VAQHHLAEQFSLAVGAVSKKASPMPEQPSGGGDVAGVVAPPPLIYLGFLAAGLGAGYLWPLAIAGDSVPAAARMGLGAALAVLGIVIGIAGLRQFRQAGTNVRPDRPTTALVATGVYRYSRNPLYIALALVYAGIALAADSLWALAFLVPTLVVVRYGVIAREEAYLERRFGDEYRRFTAAVRRWL
jgi:protein-S-isoprenylcysteine O-methyltransferase Ste14